MAYLIALFAIALAVAVFCIVTALIAPYPTAYRLLYIPALGIATLSLLTFGLFRATLPETEIVRDYKHRITRTV